MIPFTVQWDFSSPKFSYFILYICSKKLDRSMTNFPIFSQKIQMLGSNIPIVWLNEVFTLSLSTWSRVPCHNRFL